ncbi:MAG: beta-galactosidase trimerization domain-containing protein, partial [Pseudomonadota bacterium]
PVALIYDYESAWAWDTQPQGADFDMFRLTFAAYRALRKLGVNIDIIRADTRDLSAYKAVLAPGLMRLSDELRAALENYSGIALLGPRTDLKSAELSIPTPMGPNLPGVAITSALSESMPPTDAIALKGGGEFRHWFEHLEGVGEVYLETAKGEPAIIGSKTIRYLAGWPEDETFIVVLRDLMAEVEVTTQTLPRGVRIRDTETHRFVFNYAPEAQTWNGVEIPAAGVHWEQL